MSRPSWLLRKIKGQARLKAIQRNALPKSAIKKFAAKPRRNFSMFRNYSESRLEELQRELPIRPPIWKKLRRNQKACVVIGARERRFFYMNDTGTGKTLLIIALAEYFYELGELAHILVLVPRKPNKYEWADEIRKHSPKTPFLILEGSTENKWRQIEENPDALIVIESYGGLPYIACTVKHNAKKKKDEFQPNQSRLRKLRELFQGVVSDEGVQGGLGNRDTLPWRICRQLTKEEDRFYFTLTGTPFGRDPIQVWSQMWLVDHGYTLGPNQTLFRSTFYSSKPNAFGGLEWTFLKSKEKELHRFLADASIRFEVDAGDLPPVNYDRKFCALPGDAEVYYEKAKQTFLKSHGNYEEQRNAFLRMRQISSGFCGFKDDETGEKAQLIFDENPKLDLLLSTVESIDPKYKQIVFYEYTWSGLKIVEELKKRGIRTLHLYGKTKDVERERRLFNEDPDYPILVMQNTFGVGLNIQIARYGFFYEAPASPIIRKQCWRRIERQGSPHNSVFMYDLIMRDTMDERILGFYKQGGDLFDAIIRGRVKL